MKKTYLDGWQKIAKWSIFVLLAGGFTGVYIIFMYGMVQNEVMPLPAPTPMPAPPPDLADKIIVVPTQQPAFDFVPMLGVPAILYLTKKLVDFMFLYLEKKYISNIN